MKATDTFKKTIKDYLEKRGSKDPLFAKIVMKPKKNMDDCITYILNAVHKSGCNGFTDDEVYSMAIHYFDEDDISVGNPVNCQVVVNHTVQLTEKDKEEARQKAISKLQQEEETRLRNQKADQEKKAIKAQEKAEKKKLEKIEEMKKANTTLF